MGDVIYFISTFLIGLYAGSLLTEAMILVPYWRRMEPSEFFRLHGTLGPKLYQYFMPLTVSAVGMAVAVPLINRTQTLSWIITAALCGGALLIFFLYFRKANASFAAHSLSNDDLAAELVRWSQWHWARTVLVLIAFAASIIGHLSA